jgi:hypothetical protein
VFQVDVILEELVLDQVNLHEAIPARLDKQ